MRKSIPSCRSNSARRGESEARMSGGRITKWSGGSAQCSRLRGVQRDIKLLQFVIERRLIQHRLGAHERDVLFQFDPRFAPAVRWKHRQFNRRRQPMDPHREGEQVLRAAPIETLRDNLVAPDVLAAERFSRRERSDSPRGNDFRVEVQANDFCRSELPRDLIESLLSRRVHRFALLMEEGGKEKEARMLHLETASPLRNAAFAQDEDLIPAPKRVDDDCPLFEGGPHERQNSRRDSSWQCGSNTPVCCSCDREVAGRGRCTLDSQSFPIETSSRDLTVAATSSRDASWKPSSLGMRQRQVIRTSQRTASRTRRHTSDRTSATSRRGATGRRPR